MKYCSVLLVLGSLLFIACENNTSSGDLGTFDAIVEGTITNSNGNAVSSASVLVISHSSECDNIQGDGISHGTTTTNSEGKFGKRIQKPSKDMIRCLNFEINPPKNSALHDTTISISTMLELKNSTPFDEENIDITY